MQDTPHTESQRTGRRRVLQASHVVVDEPIRGASPQSFVPFEVRTQEKAHFLRIAFIGASSAAAAFFFLMARRFMPFMAFAFFPPFLIALRIALRIAFAITEGGGARAAVCRALLFAGLDA